MPEGTTPDAIKTLEQELKAAIQKQDFTGALDICEEIETAGWIRAPHLAAKAQCLLKIRQKQDARNALLQAFDMEPGYQPVVALLDEHFPGWTRRPGATPTAQPSRMAQPAGESAQTTQGYYEAPEPASQTGSSFPGKPRGQTGQPPHGIPQTNAPQPGSFREGAVNWRYITEDLELVREELLASGMEKKIETGAVFVDRD